MVGSGRISSDPEDYERAFWSRRQVQKFRKARIGVFPGGPVPLQTEETGAQEQNPSTKERSFTAVYRPINHSAELRYPSV
jgi:hypothetical protein